MGQQEKLKINFPWYDVLREIEILHTSVTEISKILVAIISISPTKKCNAALQNKNYPSSMLNCLAYKFLAILDIEFF